MKLRLKVLNEICFVITSIYAVFAIIVLIDWFTHSQVIYGFFTSESFTDIRLYFNIPVMYYFIYNIVIWHRNDKSVPRLLRIRPTNPVFQS